MNDTILEYTKESNDLLVLEIIGIALLIFSLLIIYLKVRKNYKNLSELEKELLINLKSKIKYLKLICIVGCIIFTIIFSLNHFISTQKNIDEMYKNGLVINDIEGESKILVVERYLIVNMLVWYIVFRVLFKINKKISDEEKSVFKKSYSSLTAILIIQAIVIYIIDFLEMIMLI